MRRMHFSLLCAASIAVFAAAASAAPKPRDLNIPENELDSVLTVQSKAQVTAWLKYYAEMIRDADGPTRNDQIEAGRKGLVDKVYNNYLNKPAWQFAVAELAGADVAPMLDLPDIQKRVNIAMALSAMAQPSLQPTLVKMVANDNPAVRMLGWEGYRAVRGQLIAQGPAARKAMYDVVAANAPKETSPLVVRSIFHLLSLPLQKPDFVTQQDFDDAAKRSLELLETTWKAQIGRLSGGDAEMIQVFQSALDGIRHYKAAADADKKVMTNILQMLVDLMSATSVIYDTTLSSDLIVTGSIKLKTGSSLENVKMSASAKITTTARQISFVVEMKDLDELRKAVAPVADVAADSPSLKADAALEAGALLLSDGEQAIRDFTGLAGDRVAAALATQPVERGPAVRLAVLDWITALEKFGVTKPKATATAPAK